MHFIIKVFCGYTHLQKFNKMTAINADCSHDHVQLFTVVHDPDADPNSDAFRQVDTVHRDHLVAVVQRVVT